MEKFEEKLNDFMYWFCIISGVLVIIIMLGGMIFIAYQHNKWVIIFPIILFIAILPDLIKWIKGIFTLDSSNFPRFPLSK